MFNAVLIKLKHISAQIKHLGQDIFTILCKKRGRERGGLNARIHFAYTRLNIGEKYYSATGQDRFVDRILNQKSKGVFIDIGGYDGITGSNTYFFEKQRGWSGLLFEPVPRFFKEAQKVRSCICHPFAIGATTGTTEFLEITSLWEQLSGVYDTQNAGFLARARNHPDHGEKRYQVEIKSLNEVLQNANIDQVDFISLDVEGHEMEILKGFDFNAVDVDIWAIENNTQSPELPKFMQDNGYDLIEFIGVDDVFRKRR